MMFSYINVTKQGVPSMVNGHESPTNIIPDTVLLLIASSIGGFFVVTSLTTHVISRHFRANTSTGHIQRLMNGGDVIAGGAVLAFLIFYTYSSAASPAKTNNNKFTDNNVCCLSLNPAFLMTVLVYWGTYLFLLAYVRQLHISVVYRYSSHDMLTFPIIARLYTPAVGGMLGYLIMASMYPVRSVAVFLSSLTQRESGYTIFSTHAADLCADVDANMAPVFRLAVETVPFVLIMVYLAAHQVLLAIKNGTGSCIKSTGPAPIRSGDALLPIQSQSEDDNSSTEDGNHLISMQKRNLAISKSMEEGLSWENKSVAVAPVSDHHKHKTLADQAWHSSFFLGANGLALTIPVLLILSFSIDEERSSCPLQAFALLLTWTFFSLSNLLIMMYFNSRPTDSKSSR